MFTNFILEKELVIKKRVIGRFLYKKLPNWSCFAKKKKKSKIYHLQDYCLKNWCNIIMIYVFVKHAHEF